MYLHDQFLVYGITFVLPFQCVRDVVEILVLLVLYL